MTGRPESGGPRRGGGSARPFARALVLVLAVLIIAATGAGIAIWAVGSGDEQPTTVAEDPLPVRVDVGPPPDDRPAAPAPSSGEPAPARTPTNPRTGEAAPARTAPTTPQPDAGAREGSPIVWIQAGHAEPREPGYRDQTGAGTGPFGSEIGFTTRLAPLVIAELRAAGVDARLTPGRVDPLGAPGAAFVSLHHDSPGGAVAFGHAISGAGENYYRGEGSGEPSPVPYPDSAPHRPATTVSPQVEQRSRQLAESISERFRPIYTPANGAGGRFAGVQTREGNARMMCYYGFYRTNAQARVIVEAGAAGVDDRFLARLELIAPAVAQGVVDHLRESGDLE